jgi:hypothetical protein
MAVLKPANRAANLYLRGSNHDPAPRQAHQYVVVFNMYQLAVPEHLKTTYDELNQFRDRLHFLVNSVDQPKFTVDQTVLNQYNRKRVVNRSITFDPLSFRMYDTHDGLGLKFAKLLYEFEFQGARLTQKKSGVQGESRSEDHNYNRNLYQTEDQFTKSHHFGLATHNNFHSRLLKHIDIYQVAGKMYSKTRVIYPRLARFDMDQLDYAQSGVVNLSFGFQYENFLIDQVAQPLDSSETEYPLEEMFGDTAGDFLDTPAVTETENPPALGKKDNKEGVTGDSGKVGDSTKGSLSLNQVSNQIAGAGNEIIQGYGNTKAKIVSGVKNSTKSAVGNFTGLGK